MEIPRKILEQIAHNTRPTIEKHMLIGMNKSAHEEQLSQQLQANSKQFRMAVTFPTGYNGIFNVTNSNNSFFLKSFTNEDGFTQITIPPGAYEIESLNDEFKRIIIDEGLFTQAKYPFRMEPKFSILGYNIKISPQGPINSFMYDDSIRDILGFHAITFSEE